MIFLVCINYRSAKHKHKGKIFTKVKANNRLIAMLLGAAIINEILQDFECLPDNYSIQVYSEQEFSYIPIKVDIKIDEVIHVIKDTDYKKLAATKKVS